MREAFHCGQAVLQQLFAFFGVQAEVPTIADTAPLVEYARVLRQQGLRARVRHFDGTEGVAFPALIRLANGHPALLAGVQEERAYIIDPAMTHPLVLTLAELASEWDGQAVVVSRRWSWRVFAHRYQLPWFLAVIRRYRRYLLEVLAAGLCLQAMGIAMPLLTQVIVDKVIGNQGWSTLTVIGCSMVLFFLLQALLSGTKTYLLAHTTNKLDALLGARLFRHLLSLPLPYYENRQVGESLMRLDALTSIREFLTSKGLMAMLDVGFSVVFIAFLLTYSVPLTGVVLLLVPLYVLQNVWSVPLVKKRIDAVWEQGNANQAFLVEAVSNIATMKALAVEPQFRCRYDTLLARYAARLFDQQRLQIVIDGFSGCVQTMISLLILWLGGHMVMDGVFTLGQLIAFQMVVGQAMTPMTKLLTIWPTVQQTGLAMERMGDILNTQPEPVLTEPEETPVAQRIQRGEIALRHVDFRYRPELPPVLHDLSLDFFAGSCIGIVGRSGSGKSTLSKLIQRLYLPDAGEIFIDGRPIGAYGYAALRRQIGVVTQENDLFNRSIRENIALGRPDASMAEIIAAAQAAQAHDFILGLPAGYDTLAGERGRALSGGQRQRIAIARVLLRDPRILIFDEATSALDYATEDRLLAALAQYRRGRTTLVIAHRLRTLDHCDEIVVIDHGELVDAGTPRELQSRPGVYYDLWRSQKEMES